jgi:hypothetical protein
VQGTPFFETAIRPLTLAHLCAIFERSRTIPNRPKTVYRKVVSLLMEEWDEQRFIQRESKYANFSNDRKVEYLCHLAFQLSVSGNPSTFSLRTLQAAHAQICGRYGLAPSEAVGIVNELESHTGLLLRTAFQEYEFAHKSLQEYLTAEYLVRLPHVPERHVIFRLTQETAIAVTVSADPSAYLSEVVLRRLWNNSLESDEERSALGDFVARLAVEHAELTRDRECALSLLLLYTSCVNLPHVAEVITQGLIELLARVMDSAGLDFIGRHYSRGATRVVADSLPRVEFWLRPEANEVSDDYHIRLPKIAWLPARIVDGAELV